MSVKVNVGDLLLQLLDAQIRSVLKSTDAVAQHIFLQVNELQEIAELLEREDDGVLCNKIQKVAASVGEEMQFQDTTRQQLEHVLASISYFVAAIGHSHALELEQSESDLLMQRIRDGYVMESERKRHDAVLNGDDPDLVDLDSTSSEDEVELF
ncbi:MAG: hypothetical protein Q9M13_05375 [Mariprofundales bacterium]|nr:hypothetical protein [Mariprofundales bacterium]